MRALLDSHVIAWWQSGGQKLSRTAQREIDRAELLLVSPISCWEIGILVAKGRITLDRDIYDWTRDLLSDDRVELAPLSWEAAVGASLLEKDGFHGDPADRFLYATARDMVVPLITKDQQIREFAKGAGDLRTIW